MVDGNIQSGWSRGRPSRSSVRHRHSEFGLGKIVLLGTAALALLAGAERVTRTPLEYHGVSYLGYNVDKTEGTVNPVFGIEKYGWQPGSIAFPPWQEDVTFRNGDRNFNCDDAYEKKGAHASDSGRYDVSGYHSWFFGDVATHITPTKVKSL